jgi:Holliday junction resolvasome RuvABC DNA-binding subunit
LRALSPNAAAIIASDRHTSAQASASVSPSIEDAEAALASLGYSAREARSAVASALATLDDDAADAAAIVKAALRARR